MLRDRPSLSLRAAVALAALLAFLVTGAAGLVVDRSMRGNLVAEAQSGAEAVVAPALRGDLSKAGLTKAAARSRTKRLGAALSSAHRAHLGVRIWNRTGRPVYADRSVSGLPAPSRKVLASALEGRSSSRTAHLPARRRGRARKLLCFQLPLRVPGRRRPAGLIEIVEPYSAVAERVGSGRKTLLAAGLASFLLLTVGLGWLVLASTDRLKRRVGVVEREAGRDPLTGLPNRVMFRRLTEEALQENGDERHLGVVLLDLDRFKEINDALGHFNGDLVLKRLGGRLAALLREGDVVARLGGDEFAILLPALNDRESASHIANRISEALREPFTASGLALEVEASMGIAIFPDDGDDAEGLLRAADVAMYAAKRQHLTYLFHAPDQHRYRPEQLGLAAELRRAIDRGEILLHYQPKVCLQTNEVQGVEALVRWQHRHRGLLFPDSFIPVTEHTSLIRPLTSHVIELALAQLSHWREQGIDLKVAVNLSAQILLDNDFPREVAKLLFDLHTPSRLEVEVTESSIMQDPRRATALLGRLRDLGVGVSIDDFGTGYSSLAALKQLPVDTLKIDKSFVMGMEESQDDEAIVEATSRLGQNLGLTVVAEGVESADVARKLAGFGCHQGQGYYFSKPVEAETLRRWMLAYRDMFPSGASAAVGSPLRGVDGRQS